MSFRPQPQTGSLLSFSPAPFLAPAIPSTLQDGINLAGSSRPGRWIRRGSPWLTAVWLCLAGSFLSAQEVPENEATQRSTTPANREWTTQVPALLPSVSSETLFPAWHQVSLVSRLTALDSESGGWRPAKLGDSSGASSGENPSSVPANPLLESALQSFRTTNDAAQRPTSTPAAQELSSAAIAEGVAALTEVDPWVQMVLAEGQQLASGDRWSEALSIYQTALRKAPHSRTLLQQRQTARIHVDLRHRLTDPKYVLYARTDSVDMALAHLNEIMFKIELNHLAQPDWSEIFRHGLHSLTVALKYPDFQTKFLDRSRDDQVDGVVTRLRGSLGTVPVRNQAELIGLIRELAYEMERQIGLRSSVVLHEFAGTAASALDTYSTFLSPGQFDDLNSQIRGNFVGIGVELRTHPDHLEIIKAIPGGPADRARIRGGDKMLAVNDRLVSALGGDQAADLLRGNEGSTVTVVVETPEGTQYRLKMQRARVEIPSIEEARMLDSHHGVGYLKLSNFQKNTPADFDRSLRILQQQGIRHLILDLRDNPGGALDAAVAVADRFVSQGTIVSTKGRSLAENMTYSATAASFAANLPLTVLINENSASASEILAGAIADHKRGTIIGQKSFGKGVVQTILPLTSGRGGIRLTTAEYFSPRGQRVEMQGVTPDLVVQTTARPALEDNLTPAPHALTEANDEVLAAALRRAMGAGQAP